MKLAVFKSTSRFFNIFWKLAPKLPFLLATIGLLVLVYDKGFNQGETLQRIIEVFYMVTLSASVIAIVTRYFFPPRTKKWTVWLMDGLFVIFLFSVVSHNSFWAEWFQRSFHSLGFLKYHKWLYPALFFSFVRELSALNINFKRQALNPAQLFIASFLFIIILGTLMLLLPNATHQDISFIDALFTSTSAVCVTGLIVVDTGNYFTQFGQYIILALIQLGGIGIMTFTSYFSYFFRGGASFENHLVMMDMTNTEKLGEVYSALKKIILLTFVIELIGAVLVYSSLPDMEGFTEKAFFSVFHAISAFCNAGFSTLSDSLYDIDFRFNYSLQLIIASLFIFGGMGFPIIFNFSRYITDVFISRLPFTNLKKSPLYFPSVISLSSRIIVTTTLILIAVGATAFYLLEYDHTLAEHEGFGKFAVAFFGGVTPRTAGFNSVDMAALQFPTIMIIFLLMWIGASPGSTGGGIKTSTFAIATLNFINLARDKDRVEIFGREISNLSIKRAFAMISLSLAVIGGAIFLVSIFDRDKHLIDIGFECFSAYSTVGLSLGITPDLSTQSKLVIIGTMFIGRVSMLTILAAMLKRVTYLSYRYPSEDILIN